MEDGFVATCGFVFYRSYILILKNEQPDNWLRIEVSYYKGLSCPSSVADLGCLHSADELANNIRKDQWNPEKVYWKSILFLVFFLFVFCFVFKFTEVTLMSLFCGAGATGVSEMISFTFVNLWFISAIIACTTFVCWFNLAQGPIVIQ